MDVRRSSQRRHGGQQQQQQLSPTQLYYQWATAFQQQQQQQQQRHHQQQLDAALSPPLLQQPQQHPQPTANPLHLHQQNVYQYRQPQQQAGLYQYQQPQQQQQQQYPQQQQQQQRVTPSKASDWLRASKRSLQLDVENHPQGRSGDDIVPILLEETTVKCPVTGCGRCLVPDFTQASFGFVLDEDVDKVLNSSKAERKTLLLKFLRMVNTLLNQGGGLVFIHTSPHLLNFWDEQVDDDLMDLVPDDTLFDENFERHVVEGHVIFRVKPRRHRPLSTLDFQSKISLNKGLVDPTHGQVRRLLTRPAPDMPAPPRATLDSHTLVNGQRIPFHENLNVQAKVVLPKDLAKKTPKTYKDTASKLMYFWWHSLKLPLYIAAFAKQQSGGSFFLGLKEEKEVSATKWKPLPNSSGLVEALDTEMKFWADDKNSEEKKIFHLAKESDVPKFEHKSGFFTCKGILLTQDDKDSLEKLLEKNVQDLLLLHPQNDHQKYLVKLYFYEVKDGEEGDNKDTNGHEDGARGGSEKDCNGGSSQSSRLYVVEARVNYFHGLCFQNKRGPESYKFNHDLRPSCAVRVPIKEWVEVQA